MRLRLENNMGCEMRSWLRLVQFSQRRTSVRVTLLRVQFSDSLNLKRNAIPNRDSSWFSTVA